MAKDKKVNNNLITTSTTSGSNTMVSNVDYPTIFGGTGFMGMKIANILADHYLSEPEGMEQYFFYNHDFYQIKPNKVLRIRVDIVNRNKLFKKKKK